jgi:NifU-like protein involved in Fe-S cluster formation
MSGGPAYSERVLRLFRELPGAGPLAAGPGSPVSGEALALEHGAWVRLEARIDGGRIVASAFTAWGCPHVLAAAAWLCEALPGLAIADAAAITARRMADELAAPAEKMGRLLVVEDALRSLLAAAPALQSGTTWRSH